MSAQVKDGTELSTENVFDILMETRQYRSFTLHRQRTMDTSPNFRSLLCEGTANPLALSKRSYFSIQKLLCLSRIFGKTAEDVRSLHIPPAVQAYDRVEKNSDSITECK